MHIYRIDEIPMERGDQMEKREKNIETTDGFLCEIVVLIKLCADYPGRTTIFFEKKNLCASVFNFVLSFSVRPSCVRFQLSVINRN